MYFRLGNTLLGDNTWLPTNYTQHNKRNFPGIAAEQYKCVNIHQQALYIF